MISVWGGFARIQPPTNANEHQRFYFCEEKDTMNSLRTSSFLIFFYFYFALPPKGNYEKKNR